MADGQVRSSRERDPRDQRSPIFRHKDTRARRDLPVGPLPLNNRCRTLGSSHPKVNRLHKATKTVSDLAQVEALRIDNRRQSAFRATLHYSLAQSCTISYHIPNDSLYFCLPYHINDIMITHNF